MDWLKGFDLSLWWRAAIAVGLAITIAALAANNLPLILIGLGIVACGFGEWVNHPMLIEFMRGGTLTSHPRFNRPLGLMLDALGIALVGFGIYRLIMS
jgi:hypothetical protein